MNNIFFSTFLKFESLFKKFTLPKKVALLFDSTTNKLFSKEIESALLLQGFHLNKFIVPSGEKSKSLQTAELLYGDLIKHNIDRNTSLIAIGGGVIGDLGGFVAASYLRGIPLVHVPTTLLAMVDSAIGGKVGVNHSLGKNMVGFFYQPVFSVVNIHYLKTLNKRDLFSGLAEAFKYALIQDPPFLKVFQESYSELVGQSPQHLSRLINRCIKNKLSVVNKDFHERLGIRATLNFGHTFAHAIEKESAYEIFRHGEAVLIGMLCASFLSRNLGFLSESELKTIIEISKKFYIPRALIKKYFISVRGEQFLRAMERDKKRDNQIIQFVLLRGIGNAFLYKEPISSLEIERAINEAKTVL